MLTANRVLYLMLGLALAACSGSLVNHEETDDDVADDDATDDDEATEDDDASDDDTSDDDTGDDDAEDDADGDGYTAAEDCDDNDPGVHPGASEDCDGVDNDCDGDIDPGNTCPGCSQDTHDGHTYLFCDGTPRDWETAADWCAVRGYYLVTVNDDAENSFLVSHFASGMWWIGFNDIGNEGNFGWIGGNGSGYDDWHSGEPSNYMNNEHCTEMGYYHWEWNDNDCTVPANSICELDG